MSILVIVESPAKSKTINKYLGPNYKVQATVGHIVDLRKGIGDLGINFEKQYQPIYSDLDNKRDVIKSIVASAKNATEIFIASDPDREGEAIAFHVYEKIKHLNVPIKRAEFHEITKAGIKKGLDNARDLNQNLFNAQQARRVLDRIVGFMVSPYLSSRFFEKSLSAGRVQSVALKLIVDREREIEAFKSEDYWTILAHFQGFQAHYPTKLKSDADAKQIKSDLLSSTFIVASIDAKSQRKPALPPLNTADLQKVCANRYKFTADHTIKTAQSLYEQGFCSYIRTDSYRTSDEAIASVRSYIQSSGMEVPESPNIFKNKDASQDAHEAIRPTDVSKHPDSVMLNEDQAKVYRVIWERFVASQMKAAIYDTVQVTIEAGKHKLKANGRILAYKGWLEIVMDEEKNSDVVLPKMNKGDKLTLVEPKIVVEKKSTKPPSRYNDGSVIDELKKKNIGRPSTYATILNKLGERDYCEKVKGYFQPTELGRKVVEELEMTFQFMKYDYTSNMEDALDLMSQGKTTYFEVVDDFYKKFREELLQAKNKSGLGTDFVCPICSSAMTLRHSKYGFFAGCIKYPDCRGLFGVKFEGDKVVKNERHELLEDISCPKCSKPMVLRDGQYGPFYSCSNYPRCFGKRPKLTSHNCEKCGASTRITVIDKRTVLACISCRNLQPIPENESIDWKPPESVIVQDLPKNLEKIIKKTRNKLEID
jgi:DNA topoisomerase-1